MAVLESCPKHNMVAYLEKTDGNAEFHEIIDFLARSSIHNALTVSPVVSTTFVEQFWMSAKSKIINNVRYITAKVAGKPVSISEASIRSDLLFDDPDPSPRPSPRPSPTTHILDSIPESSSGNQGGYKSSQGNKTLEGTYQKALEESQTCYHTPQSLDEELADDMLDYMDTENAKDVGRTRNVVYKEKESAEDAVSTEDVVSVDKEKKKISSTIDQDEVLKEEVLRQQHPTPTHITFGDDETIAQVLLNMSQAKAVSREKEKGVKLKDIQKTKRPRPTSTRSFLTLKSLPKIDPKDKGKKKIKKRLKKKVAKETPKKEDTSKVPAEVDVTEKGIKERKGGHIKMLARKRNRPQSDVDSDDEHKKCLKIVTFEGTMDSEIMERKSVIARLNKVSSPDGDYLVIYRANGNFRAFNCLLEVLHIFDRQDLFHLYDLVMEQYSEITLEGIELILWGDLKIMMESSTEENDQKLEDGTVIHMLVERRYPLSKDLLQRMLDLGLEVERESTAALDLIRFIKQQIDEE
ncbi:hypothetical protein Tco_1175897 [Tanacetum coccineum]